jgi:hypothetical protein
VTLHPTFHPAWLATFNGSTNIVGKHFTDAGVGFATLERQAALGYPHSHPRALFPRPRAVFQLELHSALWIPDPGHRSDEFVTTNYWRTELRQACAQFVVPPASTWQVTSVRAANGLVDIGLRQV